MEGEWREIEEEGGWDRGKDRDIGRDRDGCMIEGARGGNDRGRERAREGRRGIKGGN